MYVICIHYYYYYEWLRLLINAQPGSRCTRVLNSDAMSSFPAAMDLSSSSSTSGSYTEEEASLLVSIQATLSVCAASTRTRYNF